MAAQVPQTALGHPVLHWETVSHKTEKQTRFTGKADNRNRSAELNMFVHVCNPSTFEIKARGFSGVQGKSGQPNEDAGSEHTRVWGYQHNTLYASNSINNL